LNNKKLKILFVRPLVKYPIRKEGVGIPLAYLYLSSYLLDNSDGKVEPSILDYRLDKLDNKPINPENDFGDYDIIATGASTSEFPPASYLLKQAKDMGKITIIGGIFPTENPKYVLSHNHIDYVVRGEGEQTLKYLLDVLYYRQLKNLKNVKGISFKNKGKIIHTGKAELLKSIPEIISSAYSLIPLEKYKKYTHAHIMTSRGCPFNCSFCSLSRMWRRTYRNRNVDSVIKELFFLQKKGFERVHIKDDSFTLDKEYTHKILDVIIKEKQKGKLVLNYKVKSRIDGMNASLLTKMSLAGIDTIHFGVESVSNQSLKKIGKGGTINKELIQNVLSATLKTNIKVNPVFMLAIPNQGKDELAETIKFIEKLGKFPEVIVYMSFNTPHPHQNCFSLESDMFLLENDLNRFTHNQMVAVPVSLSTESGRCCLVDTYHEIAKISKSEYINPPLGSEYLKKILYNTPIQNNKIPLYLFNNEDIPTEYK